jgi:hypothetical protein
MFSRYSVRILTAPIYSYRVIQWLLSVLMVFGLDQRFRSADVASHKNRMSALPGRVPGVTNLHFWQGRNKVRNTKEKISVSQRGPILMRILFLDDGIVYKVHSLFHCFGNTSACIFKTKIKRLTIAKTSGYNAVYSFESESWRGCYLFQTGFLFGLFFGPQDGGDIFLRNVV